jgi:hypothetical protein
MRDEKLGAVGIRAGIRHRKHTGASVLEVLVEFIGKIVTGAAGTGAFGTTALDHEVVDDAVESQTVVEAVFSELFEILDGLRRLVVVQLDSDIDVLGGLLTTD